jgi:hypothetical protein
LALKDLENALKCDNLEEIRLLYENLKVYITNHKNKEKKVFKSFFRNINYKQLVEEDEKEKLKNSDRYVTTDDDNSLGKPELRVLNLY